MWTPAARDKERQFVVQAVKRLSSFGIKGQRYLVSIVIGPVPSVNGKQADVKVREHLLLGNVMQFRKGQDGHQVPGQRTSGGMTFP